MLGLGGLLAIGLNMHVAVPQADAEGACAELTVSPSGLAFCDTSVGQGIPATKGLLIKVCTHWKPPGCCNVWVLDYNGTVLCKNFGVL